MPSSAVVDFEQLRCSYIEALLKGQRREAIRVVLEQGLGAGASVFDLQSEIVQASQREIGRLWQENVVSIAQEHQATAISQVVLAHLYDAAPAVRSNGKRVIVACVEGEQHELPARMVSDALDLAGFTTLYLGANVPTRSLVERVVAEQPDLVALSATMVFNISAAREAVASLRAATKVPLALGGGACLWAEGMARDLDVDLSARSALELVEAARNWFGVPV